MRLLITGANGQLGQELAELCATRAIPAMPASKTDCDISSADQVTAAIRSFQPSVIVNAAAYTQVDGAEGAPELAFRVNRDGSRVLAEASASAGVPLIHISTDYVFDGTKSAPYLEQDDVRPLGVYGRSKEAGEREIRQRQPRHVILRTAWVYGRHGRNFLKTMMTLAATRDSLGVVDDQLGNPTATEDIAEGVLRVADRLMRDRTCCGTYHLVGAAEGSWYAFARDIVAAQAPHSGKNPTVNALTTEQYPTVAPRPRNSRLSSDLFAATFGYRAEPWQHRVAPIVAALWARAKEGK